MEANQFCLRWNNFLSSIVSGLESLHNSEDLVDVTITCEGKTLKAHKVILSACSPYFRSVFKENPCQHPIVILKNVLYSDMAAILRFMYQGEVLISQNKLSSFLQTAELLEVSGLNKGCTQTGLENIENLYQHKNVPEKTECNESIIKRKEKQKKHSQGADEIKSAMAMMETVEMPYLDHSESDIITIPDAEPPEIKQEIMDAEDSKPQTSTCSDSTSREEQSILERSLTSHGMSPQAAKQYAMEHVSVVHEPPCSSPSHEPEPHVHALAYALKDKVESTSVPLHKHKISDLRSIITKRKKGPCSVLPQIITDNRQTEKSVSATASGEEPSETLHHNSQGGNCPHCGLPYSNQSALKYHVRLVHSELTNMFSCHLCPEYFTYREGYKTHMWESHSVRH